MEPNWLVSLWLVLVWGQGPQKVRGDPGKRVSLSLPARDLPFSRPSSEYQEEVLGLADLHKLGLASVHSQAVKEPGGGGWGGHLPAGLCSKGTVETEVGCLCFALVHDKEPTPRVLGR